MTLLLALLLACPVTGKGGDPLLNSLKNRTQVPDLYEDVSVGSMLDQPAPTAWHVGQKRLLQEDKGVRLTGYLIKVKLAGKESCNCEDLKAVDWHLEIANSPHEPLSKAVVCEITPRYGRLGWTIPKLKALVGKMVTVEGWELLDTEHLHGAESWRGTEWEIHPVTKLQSGP